MNLVLISGGVDAIAVAVLGAVAAGLQLFGYEAEKFYSRVIPATATLLVTSTAGAIIFGAARYFAG